MDGKQLKNSILQWAIQGKLVPQNPKDEPASKLLERIAAVRNESTLNQPKGAKLKKSAPTSRIYCENGVWYEQVGNAAPKDISDDIPFEIPENWAWTRMGNIGSWGAGATPAKGNPAFYKDGVIPWLVTGELNNSVVTETKTKVSKIALEKCSLRLCKPGDVLIAMYGATIGKLAIAGIELTTNQACCACSPHYDYNKYLFYFLMASKSDLIKRGEGGAQPNISKEKLVNYLMPFPPLAEQKRIVAKLEQVLPLADEYGVSQEQLDKLNKELPETLKKSILQQAIQGKLVPQNPKDEPAQKLLEKIRKEKEALVIQGKLKKKDLKYNPIDEGEIPFELPENWVWCRLGDIVSKLVDGDHNPPVGISKKTEYMMLSSRNINFDKLVDLDNVRYLEADVFSKENERTEATIGDVLFTSVGTIGRSCVLKEDVKICFQRSVTIMTTYVYNEYLKRFFDSPFYQNYANEHAVGTAQRGFYLKEMEQSLIALPPLAEQKRIVAKLEQLFKVL